MKEKLIANRMLVSFLLLLLVMASCFPLVVFQELIFTQQTIQHPISHITYLLLPVFMAFVLITWLIYSGIKKSELIQNKKIRPDHSDFIEDIENHHFKKDSKIKPLFAAYGLSIGLFIIFLGVMSVVSPELLEKILFSEHAYILLFAVIGFSYLIVRKRIK